MGDSMPRATVATGGSHGCFWRLNDSGQEVPECHHVILGHGYAGSHHFFVRHSASEKIGGIRSDICECQCCKIAVGMKSKSPIANDFWNVIRINYSGMLRLLSSR